MKDDNKVRIHLSEKQCNELNGLHEKIQTTHKDGVSGAVIAQVFPDRMYMDCIFIEPVEAELISSNWNEGLYKELKQNFGIIRKELAEAYPEKSASVKNAHIENALEAVCVILDEDYDSLIQELANK